MCNNAAIALCPDGMLACISGFVIFISFFFFFFFFCLQGPSIILSVGIMYLVSAAAMMVKTSIKLR